MARQLDSWHAGLPAPLQWAGDDISAASYGISGSCQPRQIWEYKCGPKVLTAELRTRFYYARFILYRPFVFKALHFAQLMTAHDAECCASAIRAACLWPITLAPARDKKLLIPHLFTWTQNFIGILPILWMSRSNDCLNQICREQLDGNAVDVATTLMLEWIRDIKQIDGIAEWSWQILEPLFSQSQ